MASSPFRILTCFMSFLPGVAPRPGNCETSLGTSSPIWRHRSATKGPKFFQVPRPRYRGVYYFMIPSYFLHTFPYFLHISSFFLHISPYFLHISSYFLCISLSIFFFLHISFIIISPYFLHIFYMTRLKKISKFLPPFIASVWALGLGCRKIWSALPASGSREGLEFFQVLRSMYRGAFSSYFYRISFIFLHISFILLHISIVFPSFGQVSEISSIFKLTWQTHAHVNKKEEYVRALLRKYCWIINFKKTCIFMSIIPNIRIVRNRRV